MQGADRGNRSQARRQSDRLANPFALTRNDTNYWDNLHYRVPIATRIAKDLAAAVFTGRESDDGSYVLLVR